SSPRTGSRSRRRSPGRIPPPSRLRSTRRWKRPTRFTSCATSPTSSGSSPTRRRPTSTSRRAGSERAARAGAVRRALTGPMSGARRLESSIVASALLHALVLGVVLRGQRVTLRPPLVAIPVALVGAVGGGPASEPAPAPAVPAGGAPAREGGRRPPRGPGRARRACGGCAHDPLLRLRAARRVGRDDGARALALRPGAPGRHAGREPRHGADPLPARRRAGLASAPPRDRPRPTTPR